MAYIKPPTFDDLAFVICCAWADNIGRAMTCRGDFPSHAPANYDEFHAYNPHAVSAVQGNTAIDREFVRRTEALEHAQRHEDEHLANVQQLRDTDKLSIPVVALKVILDHDATVARLHTAQVAATTRALPVAPRAPVFNSPRTWYFRRNNGNSGAVRRGAGIAFILLLLVSYILGGFRRPMPRQRGSPDNWCKPSATGSGSRTTDVEMREAAPAQGAVSAFAAAGPATTFNPFAFTQAAQATGTSSATAVEPENPPVDESAWGDDYEMVSEAGRGATPSVTEGIAGLGLETTTEGNDVEVAM
ncbi:hypothetical protein AURDEDRAFT_123096 [Auricularia subglabra TFB-10046 SS5]|nr:hypothetical protein AURDEDRAFT_123096 [Auricularia subglabra TFB-10046 SS5]